MSDFFTRLAGQAVGAVEVIKPRVPYRFEQPMTPVPSEPMAEQNDEKAFVMEDVSPRPTKPAKDPRPASAKIPMMPPPDREERLPRDVSQSIQQPAPAPKASSTHSESWPMSRPQTIETVQRIESVSTFIPQSITNSPLPGNENLEKETPSRATKDKARQATRTEDTQDNTATETSTWAAPQPVPRPEQARPLPPSTPQVQRSSRLKSDQTPPVLRPQQPDEQDMTRAAAASHHERRAEPSQGPTIKVTIGRVEVRAIMEPPKPASIPRKPAKSAISLNDYLKRHEERRR